MEECAGEMEIWCLGLHKSNEYSCAVELLRSNQLSRYRSGYVRKTFGNGTLKHIVPVEMYSRQRLIREAATTGASEISGASSFHRYRLHEIAKMEGYLAHKWGVTSVLPSGHAYKTTALTSTPGRMCSPSPPRPISLPLCWVPSRWPTWIPLLPTLRSSFPTMETMPPPSPSTTAPTDGGPPQLPGIPISLSAMPRKLPSVSLSPG